MDQPRPRWHVRSVMSLILISALFSTVPTPSNSDAGAAAIQNRRGARPGNAGTITFRIEPRTTPSVSEIDYAVKQVMEKGHVRGAALAIVQGTHLVYTKGYTLAEPNYTDVRPVTYFRQASVSKMVTALAVYQLLQEKKLPNGLDTTLQSILHLKPPTKVDRSQPLPGEILKPRQGGNQRPVNTDNRFGSITLRHLLEMSSGLDADLDWADLQTAEAFGSSLPVSARQLASYCASEKLWATPGDHARQAYNNTGYLMLSLAVARLRNAPSFVDAIGPTLLRPLSIRRVRESRSLLSAQLPDEAHYDADSPETDPSVMTPDRPAVPLGYGTENIQNFLGGGGLSAAVTDMARLLAALSMSRNNPILSNDMRLLMLDNAAKTNDGHAVTDQFGNKDKTHGCHGFDAVTKMGDGVYSGQKGGYLVTSQSSIYFETNGISFAIAWNSHTTKPGGPKNEQWYPNFQPVLDAARKHDWGKIDLFPMYGMPPLTEVEFNRSVIRPLPVVEMDRSLVAPRRRKSQPR